MSNNSSLNLTDFHFYETLKKNVNLTLSLPKQKLNRKQTLDVIFPEISLDQNGYISSKDFQLEPDDDSAYSTIQYKCSNLEEK